MSTKDRGYRGEQLAAAALKKRGYRILEKNYRCRYGEIDIIASKGGCLVFVEVRSKGGGSFGTPEESVTASKRQRIVSTAMDYLSNHKDAPGDWRIDLVAIDFDSTLTKVQRLEIIENAIS